MRTAAFFPHGPLSALPPLFESIKAPRTICGLRCCRRHGGCVVADLRSGEPLRAQRIATPAGTAAFVALAHAYAWLTGSLMAGLPQPFSEWPQDTVGPRPAAGHGLPCDVLPGPEVRRFRGWWPGVRAAALAAGWPLPRRAAASPRWLPLRPPKPRRRGAPAAPPQPPKNGTTGCQSGRKRQSNP